MPMICCVPNLGAVAPVPNDLTVQRLTLASNYALPTSGSAVYQEVPAASWTALTGATKSGNGLLVAATGLYKVTVGIRKSAGTISTNAQIWVNGVNTHTFVAQTPTIWGPETVYLALNANDVVTLRVSINTTTAANRTLVTTSNQTFLQISPTPWLNRVTGIAPRNGTTSHTVSLGFTPANKSLLVAVICGAVTHTTPSGWTEVRAPVASAEIALLTKVSDGTETDITVTHNGSDYPIVYAFYEFPRGSTVINSAMSTTSDNVFPVVGTLGATEKTIMAIFGGTVATASSPSAVPSTAATALHWLEDLDLAAPDAATDGAWIWIAFSYNTLVTATTTTLLPTLSVTNPPLTDREKIVLGLQIAPKAVSDFTFSEGSGNASGGNGYSLVPDSSASWGTSNIDEPFTGSIGPASAKDFTIMADIFIDTSVPDWGTLVYEPVSQLWIEFQITAGFKISITDATGPQYGGPVTKNAWQTITWVRSGTTGRVYKNGVLLGSGTVNAATVNLGAVQVKKPDLWAGNVDNLRTWSSALETSEILALSNY